MSIYGRSPMMTIIDEASPVPEGVWRTLYQGVPIVTNPTHKPKKLTKDQQIAELQSQVDYWKIAEERASNALRQKNNQYDRACRDIEWFKDTVRQLIAATGRAR